MFIPSKKNSVALESKKNEWGWITKKNRKKTTGGSQNSEINGENTSFEDIKKLLQSNISPKTLKNQLISKITINNQYVLNNNGLMDPVLWFLTTDLDKSSSQENRLHMVLNSKLPREYKKNCLAKLLEQNSLSRETLKIVLDNPTQYPLVRKEYSILALTVVTRHQTEEALKKAKRKIEEDEQFAPNKTIKTNNPPTEPVEELPIVTQVRHAIVLTP